MSSLNVSLNKTLKLSNVVSVQVPVSELDRVGILTEQEENFIRSKGFNPVGPLVQHTVILAKEQESEIEIELLRQASGAILHAETPYHVTPVLRVQDCIYVRYTGPQEKIQVAYDKLNVVAFENSIALRGDSYTVFLSENDSQIVVDIFMPRENNR